MKRKPYIVLLLLMLCCLVFCGCGQKATESTETEALSSETDKAAESADAGETNQEQEVQVQTTQEQEEDVQTKYLRLAEENLALKERSASLQDECAYYESLRMAKSTEGFNLKEQGMFFGSLQQPEEEPKITEIDEIDIQDTRSDAGEKQQIPQVSDAEAEEKIPRLEEENASLQKGIENYNHLIELYRSMYMGQ